MKIKTLSYYEAQKDLKKYVFLLIACDYCKHLILMQQECGCLN